jgi:hypothetical protein
MAKTKTKNRSKTSKKPKVLGRLQFMQFKHLIGIAFIMVVIAGGLTFTGISSAASIVSSYSCSSVNPTLRYGSSGSCVRRLQWALDQQDSYYYYYPRIDYSFARSWTCPYLSVDGSFGPKTLAAVKDYQRIHGLDIDGIVGPKTWASLYDHRYYDTRPHSC